MGADLERLPVQSWLHGAKASLYHPTPGLSGNLAGTGSTGYAGPSWSSQRGRSRPVVCTGPSGRSRLSGEGTQDGKPLLAMPLSMWAKWQAEEKYISGPYSPFLEG